MADFEKIKKVGRTKKLLNQKKLERVAAQFLKLVDPNPEREGLKETPKRVAKYWLELLEGQLYTNDEIAEMYDKCFDLDESHGDENDEVISESNRLKRDMVVEDNIHVYSHCEHHLALMSLDVVIAYIPENKVIGLSKMGRISEMVAKRLQLQERIGSDIAEIMMKILGTEHVAVLIRGKHGCMTARGVKSREAWTKTSCLNGVFRTDPQVRMELLSLVRWDK